MNKPLNWIHPPQKWQGCLRSRGGHDPRIAMLRTAPLITPNGKWLPFARPSYSQAWPSCTGHAWANALEAVLCYLHGKTILGPGEHLDGDAPWRKGIVMFQDGNQQSGLTLEQAFEACVEIGFLPAGSYLARCGQTWADISGALETSPVVWGRYLTPGWMPEHISPIRCVDHSYARDDQGAGHAGCIVAAIVQGNKKYLVDDGSWGPDYAFHGCTVFEDWLLQRDIIGGPYAVEFPKDLRDWQEWRQFVIRT